MKKELRIPKDWSAITLNQFSEYNKICLAYIEKQDSDEGLTESDIAEFNLSCCRIFSKVSEDELKELPLSLINSYSECLTFLNQDRTPNEISGFYFKNKYYELTDNIGVNTNFGQYIESLQAQFVSKHSDKNSLTYLAHQLAHNVKAETELNNKERDKLAEEFLEIPASIALDFSFFLLKKSRDYSLAYLLYEKNQRRMKMPFTKRILHDLVGLKRYMNWQSVVFLINLTVLQSIVFWVQIRERFSNIYRSYRLKLTTILK